MRWSRCAWPASLARSWARTRRRRTGAWTAPGKARARSAAYSTPTRARRRRIGHETPSQSEIDTARPGAAAARVPAPDPAAKIPAAAGVRIRVGRHSVPGAGTVAGQVHLRPHLPALGPSPPQHAVPPEPGRGKHAAAVDRP